jgi:hypothetical protein
MLAY